jgi:hypothetical protein
MYKSKEGDDNDCPRDGDKGDGRSRHDYTALLTG